MLPILVVEDNSINREVAVLQLKALGHPTEVVEDGRSAVEAVKARQYSLILMDVMMPGMDGCEAAQKIREHEEMCGRRTPIIAVSAWEAADNRERCVQAGMDDYLSKPYTRDELERIVTQWNRTKV